MKKFKLLTLLAALVCAMSMGATVSKQGKLPGAFSVSDTKVVYFSQGNLQYQASTGTWRFATNQYDFIGDAAGNNTTDEADRATQSSWIDLVGWGTSGWDNTDNDATSAHYQPWEICWTNHGYTGNRYGYGPSNANVGAGESWSKSSSYQNYDWGVYNAGQLGDGWRVPTSEEWVYMFNTRSASTVNETANARFAVANLFGTTRGVIIFPDSYTHPDGVPLHQG